MVVIPFELNQLGVLGGVFQLQLVLGTEIRRDARPGFLSTAQDQHAILHLGISPHYPARRRLAVENLHLRLGLKWSNTNKGEGDGEGLSHVLAYRESGMSPM